MTLSLDDFYAQMLNMAPPDEAGLVEGPLPASAVPDPMLGVTSNFGGPPTAAAQYGYSPQPRPPLPPQIAGGPEELYGPFRQIWDGLQQEQDPLAGLMGGMPQDPLMAGMPPMQPPMPPQAPMPQAMPPQQGMPPQGFPLDPNTLQYWGPQEGQDSFIAQPANGGERVLLANGFGRVLDRVNWLRSLRAQQGY